MLRLVHVAALSTALLWAGAAGATTILDVPVPDLGVRAAIVVRAIVQDQQAAWYGGHSAIVTRVRLRVTEVLKGKGLAPGAEVVVLQTGGIVEKVGQLVPGSARFTQGEDVVVFLEAAPRDPGLWILPTMAASKFHASLTVGGGVTLERSLSDLDFVQRTGSGRVQAVAQLPVTALSLDDLRAQLRPPSSSGK